MYILISGQPGTGKTTLARLLSEKLDVLYLSTDNIKMFARATEYGNQFIHLDSHSAWKEFGNKTPTNIIKGFIAHNRAIEKLILNIIEQAEAANKHLIIEGVQITPKIFKKLKGKKLGIYLDLPDQPIHNKIFAKKNSTRKIFNSLWTANYDAIKIINNHAKRESEKAGFKIIKSRQPKTLATEILNKLKL